MGSGQARVRLEPVGRAPLRVHQVGQKHATIKNSPCRPQVIWSNEWLGWTRHHSSTTARDGTYATPASRLTATKAQPPLPPNATQAPPLSHLGPRWGCCMDCWMTGKVEWPAYTKARIPRTEGSVAPSSSGRGPGTGVTAPDTHSHATCMGVKAACGMWQHQGWVNLYMVVVMKGCDASASVVSRWDGCRGMGGAVSSCQVGHCV